MKHERSENTDDPPHCIWCGEAMPTHAMGDLPCPSRGGDVQRESELLTKSKTGEVDTKPFNRPVCSFRGCSAGTDGHVRVPDDPVEGDVLPACLVHRDCGFGARSEVPPSLGPCSECGMRAMWQMLGDGEPQNRCDRCVARRVRANRRLTDWSCVAERVQARNGKTPDEDMAEQRAKGDDRDALNEALRRISRLEQDGMIMRERIHVLERGQREKKP